MTHRKAPAGNQHDTYRANPERRLERIVRGFSNHWRIRILRLLAEQPELSVYDIAKHYRIAYQTTAQHVQRLAAAGLIMKRTSGTAIRHRVTPLGKAALRFLKAAE